MEGYPQLAVLQGQHPELAIYRGFSTLNARNLLYLQAEIVDLEDQLNRYTTEDINPDETEKKTHSRNLHYLSRPNEDGIHNSQWHTALQIREKLREFNPCLIVQRQILTFDAPEPGNLSFLQKWLSHRSQGNLALEGIDRHVWDSNTDLLVTAPDQLKDSFTRHIIARCFDFYHYVVGSKRKPSDIENGLWKYEERHILRAADIVGTLISSLLPVVAVVVLYCVKNMLTRLGLVALFTVSFSLALVLVTGANRIEVFAATAAYVRLSSLCIQGGIGLLETVLRVYKWFLWEALLCDNSEK